MIFKDYYKILEIKTNRVSMEEIRQAYRDAAKKHHPDLNVGNKLAEEKIKDINEAYKILSNPQTRKKYDRKWNSYIGNKSSLFDKNSNSKEILKNMLFGNNEKSEKKVVKHQGKPIKGKNIETAISINIYEAFFGTEKKISLKKVDGGLKSYTMKIPEGINQGEKIRLVGQGEEGQNGGKPGDLIMQINIKDDKKFQLEGNNLHTTLKITPWEAALGRRIKIKSIDKEESKIYIPQGAQSGDTVTIPGKGYKKGDKERGNLIAEIQIMVPKKLTEEERGIFEKLDKISNFNPRKA